jgi:hypothetical protein
MDSAGADIAAATTAISGHGMTEGQLAPRAWAAGGRWPCSASVSKGGASGRARSLSPSARCPRDQAVGVWLEADGAQRLPGRQQRVGDVDDPCGQRGVTKGRSFYRPID